MTEKQSLSLSYLRGSELKKYWPQIFPESLSYLRGSEHAAVNKYQRYVSLSYLRGSELIDC